MILKSSISRIFFAIVVSLFLLGCSSNAPEQEEKAPTEKKELTESSETSEITCPKCGHKKVEKLPTEVCLFKYTCENCQAELTPAVGDCCVFCTYGTHKCPSMQE